MKSTTLSVGIFLLTFLFCEGFIYFYHRYVGHEIVLLNASHSTHHKRGNTDQALEDLGWVLYLAIIFFLAIIYARAFNIISYETSVAIATGLTISFAINWLIHQAYHIPNHWLNKYNWFRCLKDNHEQHHRYRRKNYGISNPFFDILLGTYQGTDESLRQK